MRSTKVCRRLVCIILYHVTSDGTITGIFTYIRSISLSTFNFYILLAFLASSELCNCACGVFSESKSCMNGSCIYPRWFPTDQRFHWDSSLARAYITRDRSIQFKWSSAQTLYGADFQSQPHVSESRHWICPNSPRLLDETGRFQTVKTAQVISCRRHNCNLPPWAPLTPKERSGRLKSLWGWDVSTPFPHPYEIR